ncbi:hypothetical protein MD484_g5414, partial [Candolleomyces efflorescens]
MHTRSTTKRITQSAPTSECDEVFDEQTEMVLPELGPTIELENDSFARSLYQDLASDSAIDNFLKSSRFYSVPERRWKLPRNYSKLIDTNFYTPYCNIISSIMRYFWRDASRGGSRKVVDTHVTELSHSSEDPSTHTSRPSLVIKAAGPSFELPSSDKIGFSNIATCIEVQVEGGESPVWKQLAQTAIYARQIFIQQPNRRFVRALSITGRRLRLFHFDRAGAQYTPSINFDDDPRTFVRLVLGISSPNEADIGLDTSIQWELQNGRKVSGTLSTRAADNTEKVYTLVHVAPFFSRSSIGGRGTTCWTVYDSASGEKMIVKDAWRSDRRIAEDVHLQAAIGVSGVVQMVSSFENRIDTRVVMKHYGRSIIHFTSAKQLLCALRDAIAGHRELFKRGTLHRDVSCANVLLGIPGAKPGERGILIDLDMATRLGKSGFHPAVDWRIGTPLFQSTSVLYSVVIEEPNLANPHDHVDDLESFFYILTYIIYTYDSQGVSYPMDKLLGQWNGYSGVSASDAKGIFFVKERFVSDAIAPRWPEAVLDVFRNFGSFVGSFFGDRMDTRYQEREEILELLRDTASSADQHYDEILRIFDTGIEALEKAENEEAELFEEDS